MWLEGGWLCVCLCVCVEERCGRRDGKGWCVGRLCVCVLMSE